MKIKKYHQTYDIDNCNKNIKDDQILRDTLQKIAAEVGTKVSEGPVNEDCAPENSGYSGLCVVEHARVALQASGETNTIHADIFSFKKWDKEKILKLLLETFSTKISEVKNKEMWWG